MLERCELTWLNLTTWTLWRRFRIALSVTKWSDWKPSTRRVRESCNVRSCQVPGLNHFWSVYFVFSCELFYFQYENHLTKWLLLILTRNWYLLGNWGEIQVEALAEAKAGTSRYYCLGAYTTNWLRCCVFVCVCVFSFPHTSTAPLPRSSF